MRLRSRSSSRRQVQLARDRAADLDVDLVDRQAGGSRLRRHEALAQHPFGGGADFGGRAAEFHAPRLAASAGVDLRLDDPHRPRQFPGGRDCLGLGGGDLSGRHRNAGFGEDALRLVFVKIHHSIVPAHMNRVAKAGRAAGAAEAAW